MPGVGPVKRNYISIMNDPRNMIMSVMTLILLGCKGKTEMKYSPAVVPENKTQVEFKGAKLTINTILYCAYPAGDPVYAYHKNKKLVLIEAELNCAEMSVSDKKLMIPEGNILVNTDGDEYSSSPGVIAMAQNSKCIKGDDIAGYNQIWNGTIEKTAKAFTLGFEVPVNFVPEKLFWNNECRANNLFFTLKNLTSK